MYAIRSYYGLSVSGGTQEVNYYVAGEWEVENGVYTLPNATIDSIYTAANCRPNCDGA